MKFWNKQHNVRKLYWTKVALPLDDLRGMYPNGVQTYVGWLRRNTFTDLKRELQLAPSNGRFYMCIMRKEIWFEDPADATWCMLTHDGI